MQNSLEIQKKDNGYSVDLMSWDEDEYTLEELVFQDPLDVLTKVLDWLGYDDRVALELYEVLNVLDSSEDKEG